VFAELSQPLSNLLAACFVLGDGGEKIAYEAVHGGFLGRCVAPHHRQDLLVDPKREIFHVHSICAYVQ